MKKIFLIMMTVLSLAGCATSIRYYAYTTHPYPAKPGSYYIPVYSASQKLPRQYQVIGNVDVSGDVGNGVTPGLLTQKAIRVARAKGADAIINANIRAMSYAGTSVYPGYYGLFYYQPPIVVPYRDTLLTFTGDLVVYKSG